MCYRTRRRRERVRRFWSVFFICFFLKYRVYWIRGIWTFHDRLDNPNPLPWTDFCPVLKKLWRDKGESPANFESSYCRVSLIVLMLLWFSKPDFSRKNIILFSRVCDPLVLVHHFKLSLNGSPFVYFIPTSPFTTFLALFLNVPLFFRYNSLLLPIP